MDVIIPTYKPDKKFSRLLRMLEPDVPHTEDYRDEHGTLVLER